MFGRFCSLHLFFPGKELLNTNISECHCHKYAGNYECYCHKYTSNVNFLVFSGVCGLYLGYLFMVSLLNH